MQFEDEVMWDEIDEYEGMSIEDMFEISLLERIVMRVKYEKSRIINKLNPPKLDFSPEEIEYLKSLANDYK